LLFGFIPMVLFFGSASPSPAQQRRFFPKIMNSIIITRSDASNFTIVPNAILNDESLSWAAKGALAYLIGKPDGWVVRVADLQRKSQCGAFAIRSILKELEASGYAKLVSVRTEKGFAGRQWRVADSPVFRGEPANSPSFRDSLFQETAPLSKTDRSNKKDTPNPLKGEVEDFPPSLDTSDFRVAWQFWCEHRRQIKAKMTPLTSERQLKMLEKLGERRAIACINKAISSGWRGLFPDPNDPDIPPSEHHIRRNGKWVDRRYIGPNI
jgi:hypothetical protein